MISSPHLESPYSRHPKACWLKGALHLHTNRSDGCATPEQMIRAYADQGYDFLAITDHDVASDYTGLDACGMTLLHGCEVSASGPHILQIGGWGRPEPLPDRQEVVNAINAAGGIAVLNHPNLGTDFDHFPFEQMAALRGMVGIEVCNAKVLSIPGNHLATDKWDRLLTRNIVTWGFANDDAHGLDQIGRAWNMVLARDRSPEAILEALRNGSFYASTGVHIEAIEVDGMRLTVIAPDADAIAVITENGRRLLTAESQRIEIDVGNENTPHVRIECYGRGERMAWSPPLLVRGGEADRRRSLTAEKPLLTAYYSDRAPQMTGAADDLLWQRAVPSERFLRMNDAQPSGVRTTMRCIAAPDALHFAFVCEETALDRLCALVNRDGAEMWRDDSVEVFLDIDGMTGRYLQIMANACGNAFGTRCRAASPLPAVKAKAARHLDRWTVEIAIPWSELGGRPVPGTRWGFHACRNRKPVSETLVWAWVGESNHSPENFGVLAFK